MMSLDLFQQQISQLIHAALAAVEPAQAVRQHVHREGNLLSLDKTIIDLDTIQEVRLVAVGKAAAPMALASQSLINEKLRAGVVVTKYGHLGPLAQWDDPRLQLIEAGHPIPDENSLRAGQSVANLVSSCTEQTLVLACISGGASALMVLPQPGIRLSTMQAINDALLRSGAGIEEMNSVRSRLDQLKGGGLVRCTAPGRVVALILSDVVGDPIDVIASGLTYDPRATNILVANNTQGCQAVASAARDLGYNASIVTTQLGGEARDQGQLMAQAICDAAAGTCLIYGGETTVTLQDSGKGGRNQELALAAAIELNRHPACNACVAAFGTDGTDGPTDAAGALATPDTLQRAASRGLNATDSLTRHDSYHFFDALGDLLRTGPTGTNVADIVITLRM